MGINRTMKKFFIFVPVQTMKKKLVSYPHTVQASCERHSTERRLPAATVTTDAKPHSQQQLARDLLIEVERAVMGQRCRPQSFGEVTDAIRFVFLVKCSSAAV